MNEILILREILIFLFLKLKGVIFFILITPFLIVWVLFNSFDVKPSSDLFTMDDLPKETFDKSNGYYILWALTEPPEVDVTSNKVIKKYRKLFDPQYDYKKNQSDFDSLEYRRMYSSFYKNQLDKIDLLLNYSEENNHLSYCLEVLAKNELLSNLESNLKVLYNRFQMMSERKVFEDFYSKFDIASPLPNLIAWIDAAKLYTAENILRALEGDWVTGVNNLLDMLDFGKRAVKGSRCCLILNFISKSIIRLSLQAISDLMNEKECPNYVCEMVLRRTPNLTYDDFGTRDALIFEYLSNSNIRELLADHSYPNPLSIEKKTFSRRILAKLLFKKNWTNNYDNEYHKQCIEMEQTPPYQWINDKIQLPPLKQSPFWWFWNPVGKMGLQIQLPSVDGMIYKSYNTKAFYDMVKISAELHLKYEPGKPVQEVLNGLESYKVIDACSGKPYRWNDEKKVLYSIGTDRKDNNGETQGYKQREDSDYAFSVILKEK